MGCLFIDVLVLLFVFTSRALACDLTNESSWFWEENRLISDSPDIFLVKIRTHSSNDVSGTNYQAEILEVLKTKDASKFLRGSTISLNKFAPPNTDTKRWSKGWERKKGRAIYTPSCKIWVPFRDGNTYLVFFNTFHPKGYEEVKNVGKDAWYQLVKKQLKKSS